MEPDPSIVNTLKQRIEELEAEITLKTASIENLNSALRHEAALRRIMESGLRVSEEKFRTLYYESPVWMEVCTVKEGRYLDVNATFLETTGYAREEVVGRTCFDINIWPDPSLREDLKALLLRAGRLDRYPCRFRMKSGQILDFLWSAVVLHIDRSPCAVSVLTDISDIVAIERAIERLAIHEKKRLTTAFSRLKGS